MTTVDAAKEIFYILKVHVGASKLDFTFCSTTTAILPFSSIYFNAF